MYLLYSFLYSIALVMLLPFQYLKRPRALRKRWIREKFGFISTAVTTRHSSPIWVHAVSVGEVSAALPLLKRLRKNYPLKDIILSTITDTGQKVAMERAPKDTTIVYLPFDINAILRKALKMVKPDILIIMETELWPNLLRVFKKKHGVSIILLNGRISEHSLRGYRKLSFFMKRVLACVDLFCMQSDTDAERIKELGVDRERITVLGNFKFDTKPPSEIPRWAKRINGTVIVAGSTHEGEEELITSVFSELRKEFPDITLIIAPRHPERFKVVEDMLRSKHLPFIRRTTLGIQSPDPSPLQEEIVLLDSVGELSAIYGIADIAIIGKSFRGYGGQNPLEPAYWGIPILCGPHMENFPFIENFYRDGAALKVNEEGLYSNLRELLLFPEKAKEMGSKAQRLYRKNTGAVQKAMEIITGYLSANSL